MSYDALVIGAGAGGLSAAAGSATTGTARCSWSRADRVGGRASSFDERGFQRSTTGAIAIEYGGVLEETFRTVGAPVRHPRPRAGDALPSEGQWTSRVAGPDRQAGQQACYKRGAGMLSGDDRLSVEAWLRQYTKKRDRPCDLPEPVRGDLRGQQRRAAGQGVHDYFLTKGAFRDFGFSPRHAGAHAGAGRRRRRGLARQRGHATARRGRARRRRHDHPCRREGRDRGRGRRQQRRGRRRPSRCAAASTSTRPIWSAWTAT